MEEENEKLQWDLTILAAMAAEMEDYLISDLLYWQMGYSDMPKLTLGGFLMRQYRLQQLRALLNAAEKDRLETAVAQFNQALQEKIVRTETRGNEELAVRVRQWGTYLNDVKRHRATRAVNYLTAVENRAIITALIDFLSQPPYQLETKPVDQLELLDRSLRAHWEGVDFIWPAAWEAAYPLPKYWWLHGHPT